MAFRHLWPRFAAGWADGAVTDQHGTDDNDRPVAYLVSNDGFFLLSGHDERLFLSLYGSSELSSRRNASHIIYNATVMGRMPQ